MSSSETGNQEFLPHWRNSFQKSPSFHKDMSYIASYQQDNVLKRPRLFINVVSKEIEDFGVPQGNEIEPKKTTRNRDSFHQAVGPVLVLAQIFALMPVGGLQSPDATHLRFRWLDFRVAYTFYTLISYALIIAGHVHLILDSETGFTFRKSMIIVFFGIALASGVLFFVLAMRWPTLMLQLHRLEDDVEPRYGYPVGLARKIRGITIAILAVSFFEHVLANMKALRRALDCTDWTIEWVHVYYANNFKVATIFGYHHAASAIVQWAGFCATFAWNFMDLFVIVISIMLTERFRQISRRLETVRGKTMSNRFWTQILDDYAAVAFLVRVFDEHVNKIVLLTVGNNLYFICLQLLNSIKYKRDEGDSLYFYVSFGHLLLRSTAMCIFAALVHQESKQPAFVLFCVPSSNYTEEVQRFIFQVTTDHIALTGLNFFSITKTMLLTLAGTIITYEIVLVQLNSIDDKEFNRESNLTRIVNPFCPNKTRTLV